MGSTPLPGWSALGGLTWVSCFLTFPWLGLNPRASPLGIRYHSFVEWWNYIFICVLTTPPNGIPTADFFCLEHLTSWLPVTYRILVLPAKWLNHHISPHTHCLWNYSYLVLVGTGEKMWVGGHPSVLPEQVIQLCPKYLIDSRSYTIVLNLRSAVILCSFCLSFDGI